MQISIRTIYYALAISLLAASIHEVSTNKYFEVNDFWIHVDQDVEDVSSCILLDKNASLIYHSFLHRMLTSFDFRYDPRCKR